MVIANTKMKIRYNKNSSRVNMIILSKRGLMYKVSIRTKTCRTPFFMQNFTCMKNEMTLEMYAVPHQLHGWCTHISVVIGPLTTLGGDAGKLLMM